MAKVTDRESLLKAVGDIRLKLAALELCRLSVKDDDDKREKAKCFDYAWESREAGASLISRELDGFIVWAPRDLSSMKGKCNYKETKEGIKFMSQDHDCTCRDSRTGWEPLCDHVMEQFLRSGYGADSHASAWQRVAEFLIKWDKDETGLYARTVLNEMHMALNRHVLIALAVKRGFIALDSNCPWVAF